MMDVSPDELKIRTFPRDDETRKVKKPSYRKKTFIWLVNILGYISFCKDVININTEIVNRVTTDQLWDDLLEKTFKTWKASSKAKKLDPFELDLYKEYALLKAKQQKWTHSVEEFWDKLSLKHERNFANLAPSFPLEEYGQIMSFHQLFGDSDVDSDSDRALEKERKGMELMEGDEGDDGDNGDDDADGEVSDEGSANMEIDDLMEGMIMEEKAEDAEMEL